jgi:hypothetical protein
MRTLLEMKDGRRRQVMLAVLGTCIGLLALACIARAETLTLGPALTGPGTPGYSCAVEGGCGEMLLSTEPASEWIASPVNGTVVRWRIKGPSAIPGYGLNVLHDNGDGTFTVTASTGSMTPAGNEIETLATSLPIHSGEYIELNIPQNGWFTALEGEATATSFFPVLQPDETRQAANEFTYPFTFAYNADVEFEATPVTPPVPVPAVIPVASAGQMTPAPIAPPPPARCVVPDLTGKKLPAAKKAVWAAGCGVGLIAKENGVTAARGEVVKQRPKPGRLLSPRTGISVKLG